MLGVIEAKVPESHRAEGIAVFAAGTGDVHGSHHLSRIVAACRMAETEVMAHLVSSQIDTRAATADLIVPPPCPGVVASPIARTLGAPAADRADPGNASARPVIWENNDDAAEVGVIQSRIGGRIRGLPHRAGVVGVAADAVRAIGVILGERIRADDREGARTARVDVGLAVRGLSP